MFRKPGSILICIGDLPAHVSRRDLKNFVRAGIERVRQRSGGVRPATAITDHVILSLTNPATGATCYRGLVALEPAKVALEVIDELCRIPLRGLRMYACRYRHASFEDSHQARTMSMSELLGANVGGWDGNQPRFVLDLVTTTGGDLSTPTRPEPALVDPIRTRGSFA